MGQRPEEDVEVEVADVADVDRLDRSIGSVQSILFGYPPYVIEKYKKDRLDRSDRSNDQIQAESFPITRIGKSDWKFVIMKYKEAVAEVAEGGGGDSLTERQP